jgi:hypothetical protein
VSKKKKKRGGQTHTQKHISIFSSSFLPPFEWSKRDQRSSLRWSIAMRYCLAYIFLGWRLTYKNRSARIIVYRFNSIDIKFYDGCDNASAAIEYNIRPFLLFYFLAGLCASKVSRHDLTPLNSICVLLFPELYYKRIMITSGFRVVSFEFMIFFSLCEPNFPLVSCYGRIIVTVAGQARHAYNHHFPRANTIIAGYGEWRWLGPLSETTPLVLRLYLIASLPRLLLPAIQVADKT